MMRHTDQRADERVERRGGQPAAHTPQQPYAEQNRHDGVVQYPHTEDLKVINATPDQREVDGGEDER
ncbi:MAG: hypothetical protein IPO91_14785 [Chloroflexi bacterium]|nr:hypothetical protein [Chloroflexota bacterium]